MPKNYPLDETGCVIPAGMTLSASGTWTANSGFLHLLLTAKGTFAGVSKEFGDADDTVHTIMGPVCATRSFGISFRVPVALSLMYLM